MRFFRCLLGFLLGLLVTAALCYHLIPSDDVAMDEALEPAEHCDVLFVGPSYIEVGLDTEVFEATTRELGHPLRACKFTRSGLRSYELKHDLTRLMEHCWPKLRRVAVDLTLTAGAVGFERQNWFNPRMVHWHTWDALAWLYRHYRAGRRPWRELAPLAVAHVQHVAMNYLGIGRAGMALTGARWVERLAGGEEKRVGPREVNRLPRANKGRARTYEEETAAIRQLAQDKIRARAHREYADDAWTRELEPIIRKRGFEPVFLYSPVYANRMPPLSRRPGRKPLVFFDFDDPGRYPELYVESARGRTAHLSSEGARRYSRLLAQEFVKLATEPEQRDGSAPRERRERRDERSKRQQRGKPDRPGAR